MSSTGWNTSLNLSLARASRMSGTQWMALRSVTISVSSLLKRCTTLRPWVLADVTGLVGTRKDFAGACERARLDDGDADARADVIGAGVAVIVIIVEYLPQPLRGLERSRLRDVLEQDRILVRAHAREHVAEPDLVAQDVRYFDQQTVAG